ncbi:MAG: urease accessory protein UreF [Deltaproteobacteria bacterium]|nr:urease accessory protein UreF [Deltaproteobacteria bacterium]
MTADHRILAWPTPGDKKPMSKALALLYLASPALPIGAFSWSRGLESAALSGAVPDPGALKDYLSVSLTHSLGRFDLPLLYMALGAAQGPDLAALRDLNDLALAGRESRELCLEEEEAGKAVKRLAVSLGLWPGTGFSPGFLVALPILAASLGLTAADGARFLESQAFAWLQNQTSAAARIMRLGQSGIHRLILALAPTVTEVSLAALALGPDDLGPGLPAMAILSARHELEPSRLFRS